MTTQHTVPPPAQMMQMITGFWTSCCIYAAAKLDIADHLSRQPQSAEKLAEITQTHAPSLYRVLRALASVGIFSENEQRQFSLTPLGATLQSNVPGSMKAMAIAQLGDHYQAWGELLYSVRTGDTAFDQATGMSVWQYYESHPAEGVNFMKAMTGLTQAVIMNVLPEFDFSRFPVLLDVGGGNGALVSAILGKYPEARGIVYDEPYVVSKTEKIIANAGLSDRCSVAAGNFFESIPDGADAYLMKMVLHDWNDEQCRVILGNCARAMRPDARLIVIESVIPEGNTPHPGKFMDINMLTMTGGRERTEKEFAALFQQAGLRLLRVVSTHSPMFSVLEVGL